MSHNSSPTNPATPSAAVRGRLAPSPTGYMHLGNIWSFLLCWLAVRGSGGQVVLRMEDIDPERSRSEFADGVMRDLDWLGLHWDEGPDVGGPFGPYTQSERLDRYREIIDRLQAEGHTFPCYCTRKELRSMASAPHAGDYGPAYPGTCLRLTHAEREEKENGGRRPALRLHCGESCIAFRDVIHGDICLRWEETGGDFPVRRSDGVIAYQLAVVVDDMDQRITQVVRGEDILHCTPRQVALYHLLGEAVPEYAHVPLIYDHEGERLAKRHRHYEIRAFRELGISAEAVIGYLAHRAGLLPEPAPVRPDDLVTGFSLSRIARAPVVLERDIENVLQSIR